MSTSSEYVISLVKLALPSKVTANKVTISAKLQKQEIFIQQSREIRSNKINLYRQCLFLPCRPQTLSFRIYQIRGWEQKILIKEIKVPQKELNQIGKQTKMFTTEDSGYELVWDASTFTQESNDLQSVSDRDYSILDIPFENDQEPKLKLVMNKHENSTDVTSRNDLSSFITKKRPNFLHTQSQREQQIENNPLDKPKRNNATFTKINPFSTLI